MTTPPRRNYKFLFAFAVCVGAIIAIRNQPHPVHRGMPGDIRLKRLGFEEIEGRSSTDLFLVDVETPDKTTHEFCLDSGWSGESGIDAKIGQALPHPNNSVPCNLLLRNGTKIPFDAALSSSGMPMVNKSVSDGALGLGLLRTLQVRIDYERNKVWCRQSNAKLTDKEVARALADSIEPNKPVDIASMPMKVSPKGWYTVDVTVDGRHFDASVDTGADRLFLSTAEVKSLQLKSVGNANVSSPKGYLPDRVYLADSVKIGSMPSYWPAVSASDNEPDTGACLGSSRFPSRQVLIDFPSKTLYYRVPNEEDLQANAIRNYFSVRIEPDKGGLRMNWPEPSKDVPGLESAEVSKVQDVSATEWLGWMEKWMSSHGKVTPPLLEIYRQLLRDEHFTVLINGSERQVDFAR